MKPGDRIITVSTLDNVSGITEHIVQGTADPFWIKTTDGDMVSTAYSWHIRHKEELVQAIEKRQALKKAYDDSMQLFYVIERD